MLPASALPPGTSGFITTFAAFSFDPNLGLAVAPNGLRTTGVTSLSLSTPGGAPIIVANLTSPVVFSLPPVSPPAGQTGTCVWWDASSGAYSSTGCVSVPNPQPPHHTLGFTPGYATPTDASLAGAWGIEGPLAAGCVSTVLDCSARAPGVAYLDLSAPLSVPSVGCLWGQAAPLRVFSGAACALWRHDNVLGCFWNATIQSFSGPGCVAVAAPSQCMCRHLTGARACVVA